MKALITGGAGFIGSHLCQALLQRGDEVFVIDDLSTGSMINILPFKGHERFNYTIESIMEKHVLAEWVDWADIVFHLAAAVGVRLIVESPVRTIETNIGGTEAVLSRAAYKKKRVVITSTSEVYGKSEKNVFSEEDDLVLGPTFKSRWSYACSKAIDEFLALSYFREKKLPVLILRLFNTVGPGQTDQYGMVLPTFVRQALRREPITVFGDGLQTRCFSYVTDVVNAIIELGDLDTAYGQIFNVGSDEEISIINLAHLVNEMAGSSSPINLIPYDEAYEAGFEDMRRRVPDLRKIKAAISYKPRTNLRSIIKSVIDYEKNSMTNNYLVK